MQLSAPIYVLKRRARRLSREARIPLHQALDRVAAGAGFQSWSHLAAAASHESPARRVLPQLRGGDLVLLAARPGNGKTLFGLELAARAAEIGRKGYVFTLHDTARDVEERLTTLGFDPSRLQQSLVIDTSDDVSAAHILGRLAQDQNPALVVIDYLQLLDQKRSTPPLDDQIGTLRTHAARTGTIGVVLSQIDRSFDLADKPMPDSSDIRLPNPLDLSHFTRCCFLHEGRMRIGAAA